MQMVEAWGREHAWFLLNGMALADFGILPMDLGWPNTIARSTRENRSGQPKAARVRQVSAVTGAWFASIFAGSWCFILIMRLLSQPPIYTESCSPENGLRKLPVRLKNASPLLWAAASRRLGRGMGGTMRIEILCTGDEVLTGKIVNTNFSYMAQKLEDVGLSVHWGTTVGDDRESLLSAFKLAGERADAVIVNGGLGPTVDDLSQEIAAQAAGVELVLHEEWLEKMESFFSRRARAMPPNNRKQAMLPATAEMIDNPIGTACGFAMDIGKARFFFTPGVPRELRRMLEEQVIPRILARSGAPASIYLKRFHSYGIGESHADQLLTGVEALDPQGGVKLGFRAHYPQLETKLTVRGTDMDDVGRKLAPITAEVRKRLGNFIMAEDDQTLEGVVLAELTRKQATLSVVETFTAGQIAARFAHLPNAEHVFRRGVVVRHFSELHPVFGLEGVALSGEMTEDATIAVARAAREKTGASHALVVLIDLDEGADRIDFGGTIWTGIATADGVDVRRSRILGGRDWVRLGAVEMGLDCLRRQLQGLPVVERIDFERT
jgi:nicotinamide-nucleotide amidase